MSEDFNSCAKAQLLTYVPMALKKIITKHEKIISIKDMSDMKAKVEEAKAAKAILSHLEALIKLARLVIDDDSISETSGESKQELLDIIKEAQERVNENRESILNDAVQE